MKYGDEGRTTRRGEKEEKNKKGEQRDRNENEATKRGSGRRPSMKSSATAQEEKRGHEAKGPQK